MIAIGIDPSVTHTGVVVLDDIDGPLWVEAIKTLPTKTWEGQAFRERFICDTVRDMVAEWITDYPMPVFMEDYAIGGGFAKTIIPQVELGGIIRLMLANRSVDGLAKVIFVAPTSLKQFACGKGNGSKVEVATALAKRFGGDFKGDDNLWDAYGLARMALASQGHTEGLTKEQIAVVQKVVAPKIKKQRKSASGKQVT